MSLPRIVTAAVGAAAVIALTACSPTQVVQRIIGSQSGGQGHQVEAKQGADDGGGPLFAAQVVCEGENFWRTANGWTNVEGPPNSGPTSVIGENHWVSLVWCPAGRRIVATNIARGQS